MQADLLRVLQEGEVKRLGGSAIIKVNVRIIAATNKDLREEVKQGRFREDLFYRLNVLLAAYSWPGNVRELENAMEWAISMGTTTYILPEDLPPEIRACSDSKDPAEGTWYQREFVAFQKSLFGRAISECGSNQSEAARRLGLHPTSFRRRCGELGVKVNELIN
jgi:DNA-binding NtrC family response regulator